LIACLGEIICERSGNVNLGVEGMMLSGALVGYIITVVSGNPYLGLIVGAFAGMTLAFVHAFLTISMKSDQIVSGIMITLLGTGLTTFLGSWFGGPPIDGLQQITIPIVGKYLIELPAIGLAIGRMTVTDMIALALVPAVWFLIYRTKLGRQITAVGDDPRTADTMGISVTRIRYFSVLLGGFLVGIAGAHMTLVISNLWTSGVVSGRGWIAIGLVIFARWRPVQALVGAYFFGLIEALAIRSGQVQQLVLDAGFGSSINDVLMLLTNSVLMSSYPYLFTIIALVIAGLRKYDGYSNVPQAIFQPYTREDE
jgi:simple sugar transport system permease protein